MTAPDWINDEIDAFGKDAGLRGLALNDRGAAALRFENGLGFRFEYAYESLSLVATVPLRETPDDETAQALLRYAHPDARHPFRLRTGYLAKTGCAVFAVRLAEREVNRSTLATAFQLLWRTADGFRELKG